MSPRDAFQLQVATLTHEGETGKNNEDHHVVVRVPVAHAKSGSDLRLAIVCDGIGGHRAGEVASELAAQTIQRHVAGWEGGSLPERLRSAVVAAGRAVAERAKANADLRGMGSTCAVAVVHNGRLYTASVGDSRIYLLRGGSIRQLTTDHTWVQEAIDQGLIRREEARSHPNAHVIRRHLGSPGDVKPDTRLRLSDGESDEQAERNQGLPLRSGDTLLLCSDGLTDLVDDHEILEAGSQLPPQAAAERLVSLARQRGGHDNITVVIEQVAGPAIAGAPTKRRRLWVASVSIVAALLACLLIAAGGIVLAREVGWFGSDLSANNASPLSGPAVTAEGESKPPPADATETGSARGPASTPTPPY